MLRKVLLVSITAFSSFSFAHEITLDPDLRYQTMEGWGTSGVQNTTAWRTAYRDLGLNIIRVPMAKEVLIDASGDYRTPVPLSANLQSNVNLMDFSISSVSSYGQFASWMQQNALEPSRVKVVADAWTPPHWMKGPSGASQYWIGNTNNSLGTTAYPTPWLSNEHNGWGGFSHSGDSIGGRLRTEDSANLQQYGRYMAAWVTGFQQNFGVPVYGMSLQNESTFENPFDSMTYMVNQAGQQDFTQYAKGLKAVRDAWQTYGLQTKVMGPHVGNIGSTPANPWALWQQQSMIDAVRNDSDPTLKDFLSFYNSNYYMGSDANNVKMTAGYWRGASQVPANWASWFQPRGVQNDGKPVWYSETGDGLNNWLDQTNNPGALSMALKIHNALVYSDAAAYIYWQFTVDSSVSEHSLLGTSQLSNPTASKKYAAFKQFSRFIRPGADRIGATFENSNSAIGAADAFDTHNSLNVSAFINDEDQQLTIVLLNLLSSAQPVTLHIPAEWDIASLQAWRTGGTESYLQLADLTVIDGDVNFTMQPYTIVTLSAPVPEPGMIMLLPMVVVGILRRRIACGERA